MVPTFLRLILYIILCTSSVSNAFSGIPDQSKDQQFMFTQSSKQMFRIGTIMTTLGLSSGLSPAVKVISESNKSRLPDCPIAHDLDTLLLWPVKAEAVQLGQRISVFSTPAAAVTDPHHFDWTLAIEAFSTRALFTSFVCTLILFILYILHRSITPKPE